MDNLRTARNVLFKAWLINIVIVLICWGFVMADWMQFFMWALPGFTIESANLYTMWLLGAIDIAGLVLFLVPAIALSWQIRNEKKSWEKELERLYESEDELMLTDIEPIFPKSKAAANKKPVKKRAPVKKKK